MSLGFGGAVVIPRRGAAESAESYIDRLIPVLEGALTPNTGAAPTLYDNQGRIVVGPGGVYAYSSNGGLAVAPNVVTIDTQDIVDAAIITSKLADGSINYAKFATGIEPVQIVDNLNDIVSPDVGMVVFLTTDEKLYRYTGISWTAAVAASDLSGEISGTQISNGAISTPKLAANAVEADKIAANAIIAGKIAAGAVSAAEIAAGSIEADKLAAANVVTLSAQIADAIIITSKIGDAQIVTAKIADLAVNDAKIANASVSKLTAGTILADGIFVGGEQIELDGTATQISVSDDQTTPQQRVLIGNLGAGDSNYGIQIRDASGNLILSSGSSANISGTFVTNLNASNITTGTLAAARIGAGTIDATKLNVATLSAISANLGTVTAGTLSAITIQGSSQIVIGGTGTPVSGAHAYVESASTSNAIVGIAGTAVASSASGVQGETWSTGTGVYAAARTNAIGLALYALGNSAVTSQAITTMEAQSSSYASTMLNVICARAATASFQFAAFRSSGGSDNEFRLDGDGNGYADGSWTGGGADYAEYFESLTGAAIPIGAPVVLDGEKVRAATGADDPADIMGVIRPKGASVVIGNAAWNRWHGKYLRDDYGAPVMEDYTVYRWQDGDDHHESENAEDAPEGAEAVQQQRRALNPAYDPEAPYTPRSERPEWCVVGLMGQIAITKGKPVNPNWRKMKDISPTVELWLVR